MIESTHRSVALFSGRMTETNGATGGRRPRGFTLVEMIGTCLLMGMLFSMTIPMLAVVARERRSTEQRQFALQQAANLLERTSQRGWSELKPGELALEEADTELIQILPGLEQSLLIKEVEGEADSLQVIASIRWKNGAGQFVAPLRLSAWIYQKEGGR